MDRSDLLERVRAVDDELLHDAPRAAQRVPGLASAGRASVGGPDDGGLRAGGQAVDELLVGLTASEPRVRVRAASTLAGLHRSSVDGRTVAALRTAAGDAHAEVRCAALAALVCLSPDQLLPEIVKSLRSDDPRIVAGAAVVLGRAALLGAVAAGAAVPNLVEAFKSEVVNVGRAVAWALGCMGDRAVVPWLVAALEQGFAAAAAATALGCLADPRALPALLLALGDDDADVRAAAARALGRVQGAPVAPLELLLNDPSPRVRLCAALALYERGEDDGPLVRALDEADETAALP